MDAVRQRPWAGFVFGSLVWAYAYFFQGGSWNAGARYDLVRAIVEDRSFRINRFATNTYDIAIVYDPRVVSREQVYAQYEHTLRTAPSRLADFPWPIYANKAPGVSWLAVPLYALLYGAERLAGIDPEGFWPANVNVHLLGVATTGLPSALAGTLTFLWLGRRTALSVAWRLILTAGVWLGTLLWPYSTGMYGHATAAAFVFMAFYAADTIGEARRPGRRALAAGLAAGAAVAAEYSAIGPAAGIALYAVWRTRSKRYAALVILGGAMVAALLAAYHVALVGHPFQTTYLWQRPHVDELMELAGEAHDRADWTLRRRLFAWPDLSLVPALTFGLRRGLFITSPLLLTGVAGLIVGWRGHRGLVLLAGVVAAYYLLLNASYAEWDGGSALGPRYLIPAMPLLGLCAAAVCRSWGCIFVLVLSAAGVAIQLAATSVRVEVPNVGQQPPLQLVWEWISGRRHSEGRPLLSTNAQHVLELRPARPDPRALPRRWCSYNVGELMGLERLSSLLPLLVGWIALAVGVGTWRAGLSGAARPGPPSSS